MRYWIVAAACALHCATASAQTAPVAPARTAPAPAAAAPADDSLLLMITAASSDMNVSLASMKGNVQTAKADYDKSMGIYQQLLARNPNNARATAAMGNLKNLWQEHSGDTDLQKAIQLATAQIAQKPTDDDLYYVRGSAYRSLKQFAQAKADIQKSLELAPSQTNRQSDLKMITLEESMAKH